MSPLLDPASRAAILDDLILAMGRDRGLEHVLRTVADRLAALAGVALVRVWLVERTDACGACPMIDACRDRSRCLHLVASQGGSADGAARWDGLGGRFARFPLGVRKIGRIGATGEDLTIADIAAEPDWIADPAWAAREGIRGFTGKALIHRGEILGVCAVFTRVPLADDLCAWARQLSNHVALAIANARAAAEIDRLRAQLAAENEVLRSQLGADERFGDLVVGASPAMRAVADRIALVARSDATVLILGESGTGKELVAHEIHRRGERAKRALVIVNCAAIPRELFESEFFGHAKGAFTGASGERAGRFAAADGGTLFLDEVGEIPIELQGKLLRVLQQGTYARVGEDRQRACDVRIVAATNRDLAAEIAAGRFREDLYYRLNVVPIRLPPLRKRTDDLEALCLHLLAQIGHRLDVAPPRLRPADLARLAEYPWPGNIRELANVLERAVILSTDGRLAIDLPAGVAHPAAPAGAPAARTGILRDDEIERMRRENTARALAVAGGRVSGPDGAAALLGVPATTLASRIKAWGLVGPAQPGPAGP